MNRAYLLAFRSLRARPARSLLTMAGIVLGVAVILAISISNQSTLDSVTDLFNETSGKAHLVATSSNPGETGFPESILRKVAHVPGVEAAIPSLHVQALLADEAPPSGIDANMFGAIFGGLTIYGIDTVLDPLAREYTIVAGEFLSPDIDKYEIVLVQEYAERKHISLGGDLDIVSPVGVQTLRVVGLMSKEGAGQLANGDFGVVPLRAAQEVFGRLSELDQIDIVAEPAETSVSRLDRLKIELQAQLGDDYAVIYPATRGKRVAQMLDSYQIGFNFFSAIALFMGAFLIYNAFSMTIVERTREIGMLRTLGMTKRQVMGQVLNEAIMLGAGGAVLGVGTGIALSQGLIRIMELLLDQEINLIRVPLAGLATSVAVGLAVTLIAASLPAWQASRISPLEALRVRSRSRQGWVARWGWLPGICLLGLSVYLLYFSPFEPTTQYAIGALAVFSLFVGATLLIPLTVGVWEFVARPWIRLIYGSEGRLGSANIQRSKLRTALTVASLMVGVAMILSMGTTTGAYQRDIQGWIDSYVGGDLYVYGPLAMRADIARRLLSVEGISVVTPLRYFDVKWRKPGGDSMTVTFMAIEPSSYRQVTSIVYATKQGDSDQLLDRLDAGNGVFVSSVLAEQYGLKQGDTMRLETRRGEQDFEVQAIVVNYQNGGRVVQGTLGDARRYFRINDVSAYLVKVAPGYEPLQVRDRIDYLYGERRHLTIDSNLALKKQAFTMTSRAFGMFNVLVMISMVVAALGVVNTLTMSVLERTREIGMLRSLGMTRLQIGKMVLAEAGMMGLIGGILGLLFGYLLSRLFLRAVTVMQGHELVYAIPTQEILVSLLIALVVSHLAAVWPARRAARICIIQAIQFE